MRNSLDVFRGPRGSLWDVMNDLDSFFEPWGLRPVTAERREERFVPQIEIAESPEGYFVKADLPGLKREDVKLDLEGRLLTMSGERRQEKRTDEGRVHRVERSFGKFERRFTLPEDVDVEKIAAHMEDGVLTINLPRAATARSRRLEITPTTKTHA